MALLYGLVPLLTATIPQQGGCAEPLRLLTNDNPPFSIIDAEQRVTGISADIVIEMARRADVPATLEHYPWTRAFEAALSQANACIFSTARLAEREARLQWVGPIATNSWALFARDDFHGTLASIEEARGLVIGGQILEAKSIYLKTQGLTVDVLPDDDLNPRRLKEGRIDLWVTGLYTGGMKAAAQGISGVKPVLVFRKVENYLACNLAVPHETIDRLGKALDGMRADGTFGAITAHYGNLTAQLPAD